MNRLKMSIVFLVSFLAYYGGADDHASSYAGMDLSARVGLQYEVCQLREGKTLADANALTEQAGREFERLGMDLGIIMLNPMFCLLYTSPSPRDGLLSRMPSSA